VTLEAKQANATNYHFLGVNFCKMVGFSFKWKKAEFLGLLIMLENYDLERSSRFSGLGYKTMLT